MAYSSGAVLTAAQLNASFSGYTTVNGQTGTTYTFLSTDAGGLVTATNASAQTYTIPTNTTWAAATGTWIEVLNIGTGLLTITAIATVSLNGTATGSINVPVGARVVLTKTGTNAWYAHLAPVAPGMNLIGTTSSPSASASHSIDGCFSTSYSVYRIVYYLTAAAGSPNLTVRMRVATVDDSSANYAYAIFGSAGTSSGATQTSAVVGSIATTGGWGHIDVFNPAAAAPTQILANFGGNLTTPVTGVIAAGHNVSTAYDGITFIPATSTITGSIRVYGLAQ